MRALVDTCVIIDALQSREPFNRSAEAIFRLAAEGQMDGFLSAKSVTDIYYLTHRLTHDDEKTREIISKILTLFDLVDTLGVDCKKALISQMSDYEDAVMAETALRLKIDCIVTRNVRDYRKAGLAVLTPEELVG